MDHKDQSQKITAAFSEMRSIKPSSEWTAQIRHHFSQLAQDELMKKDTILSIILKTMFTKHIKLLMSLSAVAILGTAIVGGLYFYDESSDEQTSKDLTASEKQEIFAQIFQNNSSSAVEKDTNKRSAAGTATLESDTMNLIGMPAPYFEGTFLPYSYTKRETTAGPAIGSCEMLQAQFSDITTFEDYSYYSDDGSTSAGKYISYYDDGTLGGYYLNVTEGNQSTNYDYRGGDYAIKTISTWEQDNLLYKGVEEPLLLDSPEADIMPVEGVEPNPINSEPTTQELVEQYFGPDADIKVQSVSGVDYYVVTYSYETNCDEQLYYTMDTISARMPEEVVDGTMMTVFIEDWVKQDDFSIVRTKTFVNDVSDNNLVATTNITSESKDVPFSAVQDNFQFDYNVPVKEVTYDYTNTQDTEKQRLLDYLSTSGVPVLFPQGYSLEYMYTSSMWVDEYTNLYQDRAFYPQGSKGDQMFADATYVYEPEAWYDQALLSATFSKQLGDVYQSLYLNVHSMEKNKVELMKNYVFDDNNVVTTQISIAIGGQSVAATQYAVTYQNSTDPMLYEQREAEEFVGTDGSSSAGSEGTEMILPAPCVGEECSWTDYYYYFTFGGYQFVISAYGAPSSDLLFDSKTMSADRAFIESAIENSYEVRNLVMPTEPMPIEVMPVE